MNVSTSLVSDLLVDRMGLERDTIVPTADLRADLGLDSLDALELLTLLEEDLGITIPEETVRSRRTVQDVVDFATSGADRA